ncbi:glycosyltransferase family 4 protein [Pseudacidovorax intermedius]|uniref:glycosyltransferase family 4 protein n=1 Tax=Pseudacidovorax intermedius TaxID=433924 RepID=UPI00187D00FF|nr:glycosyltransferase family 1 protein [Pseudacidovorax intermedius]
MAFLVEHMSWTGGVNYFKNLFAAVHGSQLVDIYLVCGKRFSSTELEEHAQVIRTEFLDRKTPSWYVRKITNRLRVGQDFLLKKLLAKNEIDLVFHFGDHWYCDGIRSIAWIPDFQHIYYPDFFQRDEWLHRQDQFSNVVERCTALLFSSQNALEDCVKYYPKAAEKEKFVLNFVSGKPHASASAPSHHELRGKYGLAEKWIHLPNQLWIHKNHLTIVDALALVKNAGHNIQVVCTGKLVDYRFPDHVEKVQHRIREQGLFDHIKLLGVIPYEDVIGLMGYSIAVLNPSLFEGWSTSVEEAKALGKLLVLSDIPVHREQAPTRAIYFDPNNAHAAAEALLQAYEQYDPESEPQHFAAARDSYDRRWAHFGSEFERIVRSVSTLIP